MEQLKIFIVDDDQFYISLFEQQVRNLGYSQVSTFNSGTECLNQLNDKPDVIFLDHNMDTLSGYEVLKKIKRFDPNLFVVMISAQEEIKTAVDSLKHGAFDYIQKGDNEIDKIQEVLQRIIDVKEMLRKSKPGFFKKIFK
jgi:DNA-binding NtrC family response regulator